MACLLAVQAHATVEDGPELEQEIVIDESKPDFYSDASSETIEYAITQRFVGGE